MKKTLAIACGVLLAANSLHAIDIYITGSTAFRNNAYNAIRTLYGANLTSQNPSAGNPASSNLVTWSGTVTTLFGSTPVNIYASWGGSIQGIQTLAQGANLTFLSSSTPGTFTTVSHASTLAFSDVFQSSTIYTSPTLNDKLVAIQPFVYCKSITTPASVTNITIQQLRDLMSNGRERLMYFNGDTNNAGTNWVYLVGRNNESGTRLTAEADCLFAPQTPLLYAPDGSCNWSISGGFSSGGNIVTVLGGSCGNAIGYLGLGDAKNLASGNYIITYDGGLPYKPGTLGPQPDFTPTITGQYSYWSYEHLFFKSPNASDPNPSQTLSYRDALADAIDADIAGLATKTAIRLSEMKVVRDTDGGPIFP